MFSYYVSNDKYLEFTVPKDQTTEIELYEASFNMLDNPLFDVPKRPSDMIPETFCTK